MKEINETVIKIFEDVGDSLETMFPDKQKARETFLIEWYKILWNNARQSMDGIWKLIGPITVVGTIWFAIYEQYLPSNLGNTLVFIIIFWAINVTIDFNQWHRRNLIFYTAVEREFLDDKDYGRLIPSEYKSPKKGWITFYRICLYTFIALLIVALSLCFFPPKAQTKWQFSWYERYDLVALAVGLFYSIWNFYDQEQSSKEDINELFHSKKVEDHRKSIES